MPHILIEFSRELADEGQIEEMLDTLHRAVAASGLFASSHIKLRAQPLKYYRLGGERKPFIHAQLRIHVGRTAQQRRELSDGVLAALRSLGWPAQVITVEVVEMARDSYAKFSREV